jgi:hypothetical protein
MNQGITIEKMLEDVLRAQHVSCDKLLQLSKDERRYIIHAQLEDLEKCAESKGILKEEMTHRETVRQKLMPYFSKKYAIEKKDVQLSDIIEKVDEPYASTYRELQRSLRRAFDGIKRLHDGNRLLIERSIDFQERSFMLLFGLTKQNVRYEKNGDVTHERKPLVDSMM